MMRQTPKARLPNTAVIFRWLNWIRRFTRFQKLKSSELAAAGADNFQFILKANRVATMHDQAVRIPDNTAVCWI